VLLELADDPGHEIDRVDVGVFLGDAARVAHSLEVELDALGQEPDVLEIAGGVLRVFRQPRARRDVAGLMSRSRPAAAPRRRAWPAARGRAPRRRR
jgi:hypothetical protein